jgi:two-component sensor histidine kinase
MSKSSQNAVSQIDGSLLYIAELLHRVSNEYMSAISFASTVAARLSNAEAKGALHEIINHLHALAEANRVLRPPLTDGLVDLSENTAQLCRAMALAGMEKRGIRLHLALTESIMLEEARCWHASLIIAELITNAGRHASFSHGGNVWVSIDSALERIICRVSDNGSSCKTFSPGLGSVLVNALAKEIDGRIDRQFGSSGATVTLSFPRDIRPMADRIDFRAPAQIGGEMR